jgi:hypothetical protein
MAWTKKATLIIGIVLASLVAIGIGLTVYVPWRIQRTINEKVASLSKKGYQISYDTLHFQLLKGTFEIERLVIQKTDGDTACEVRESLLAKNVRASGLNIISVIFSDEMSLNSIQFDDPHLTVKENTKFLPDTTVKRRGNFVFASRDVVFQNLRIQYLDSTTCAVHTNMKSDVSMSQVELRWSTERPLRFTFGQIQAGNATVELPAKLYHCSVKKLDLNMADHTLDVDSVSINPTVGKLTFGRTKGYEADRIAGTIPFLRLRGLKLNYDDTLVISTRHMALRMSLRVFRDKRLPFKKIEKPLPIQFLQALSFGVNVDTLQISESRVEYEEFAEEATTAGKVFFENLNASIFNINNDRRESEGKTIMIARAALMGEADLRVRSEFPWNNSRKCLIQGTLQDLSITRVNSLMQAVTNIRAESGKLEKMTFSFAYNAVRSEGKLELNYRDLKLITFKDDDKTPRRVSRKTREKLREVNKEENKLKSWILNTFIIRRNVNEKDPIDKRTGEIEFVRDIHRSIFNYWWKSLLSGLRSAFDLERFNERDNRKNKKKRTKEKKPA